MKKASGTNWMKLTGLIVVAFVSTLNLHAQSRSVSEPLAIRSTKDYFEAERLIEAIADELYKAYQVYPDFSYEIQDGSEVLTVTVSGIDNHTIANRIADQILVLEEIGKALSSVDERFLSTIEISSDNMLNEQQAEAYQPKVDANGGFTNLLYTSHP